MIEGGGSHQLKMNEKRETRKKGYLANLQRCRTRKKMGEGQKTESLVLPSTILPISESTDNQHDSKNFPQACCFRCMVNQGKHEFGGNFILWGVFSWVYHRCTEPQPDWLMEPEHLENSEKAWCTECWKQGRHLREPRTNYPKRGW